ncbi:MAG TPA: hypothetical protein VGP63_25935 [Planctomycetaceae bacterium]|jgi:hypothetical protein|nr:hypothetical protein [Planctomycetaceae bacterium]
MHSSVDSRKAVNRLFLFAVAVACFATVSATSAVAQTPDPNCCPPATPSYAVPSYTQYGTRYYGAIDPYPIGYYPYATNYAPTAVGVPYALGYYPYPQPVATYAVPAPYAVGYYGYAGYAGSPYFGFPAWGWGPVYPYGFGYGF